MAPWKQFGDGAPERSEEVQSVPDEMVEHPPDDAPLTEIEKAWMEEAERRYEDYCAGRTKPLTYDEVFESIRKLLP